MRRVWRYRLARSLRARRRFANGLGIPLVATLLFVVLSAPFGALPAWAASPHRLAEGQTTVASHTEPETSPTTKTAPPRVTFGIGPATATGRDSRSELAYSATPGAVLDDHVAALNYSTQPLTLQLYATDAVETPGGGYGLLTANQRPTGVGSWVSIPSNDATIVVPAASALVPGSVVVPVVIQVPPHAAPGDHSGGIIVSLSTYGKNGSGQNIVLDQRVATRVQVLVSGKIVPDLAVTSLRATYVGTLNPLGTGRVDLSYRVTNTGNVDLGVDLSAKVSGLFSSSGQSKLPSVGILFPGASVTGTKTFSGVWPQVIDHASVTATPLVPASNGHLSPLAPITASTVVWAIPWTLLLIILLLILGFILYRRRRKRNPRRSPSHAARSGSKAKSEGDTVPKIEVPA
jgi:hypothetical protein